MSSLVIFLSIFCVVQSSVIEECFEKDSISCLQNKLYETAKTFLEKTTLDASGALDTSSVFQNPDHKSRKFDEKDYEILHARSVEQRQIMLERFFGDKMINLWSKVSLSRNKIGILRYVLQFLPKELTKDVIEARSKEKKSKKTDSLLWIGLAIKIISVVIFTYTNIAMVASKAVLVGTISLILSGYIATKNQKEQKPEGSNNWKNSPWEAPANQFPTSPYSKYYPGSMSYGQEVESFPKQM